jgi:competence protein ComEC
MPHWDRSLDAVVLSHPQEDHMAGLIEVLERFEADRVYVNGYENTTAAYRIFERATPSAEVIGRGDRFEIDGVRFDVLWPPPDGRQIENLNDTSLIILVTYGETRFLLTGDSEGPVFDSFTATGELAADVVKVPHHGSKTTPGDFFRDMVRPAVAVISVGKGNIFGHPHGDTLAALGVIPTYRTDVHGRVTIRSDGRRLTVSTER